MNFGTTQTLKWSVAGKGERQRKVYIMVKQGRTTMGKQRKMLKTMS